MFSDMNTQKLFARYSFSYLTNWQPGRYHLNDFAPLILWFMDRGAVCPGLKGHGILGSNHKERHGGDGMEVVREVDGR